MNLTPPPKLVDLLGLEEEVERRVAEGTWPHSPEGLWNTAYAETLAEVEAKLGAKPEATDRYQRPLFEPVESLFRREYKDAGWLVKRLIRSGGVGAVSTEPKSAKTWVATELAVAVATGTPAFGRYYVQRGVVAYFYAEDQAKDIRNRVRALAKTRGLTPRQVSGRLRVQPRGLFLDICDNKDLAWLIASLRKERPNLLVLDPLRDLHSAEEDRSDAMRNVMRRLRLIAELLGCTVLFVHHSIKLGRDTDKRRGGQQMRGSSAIHGAVDFGLYLSGLSGDGKSVFSNKVESEVKGARGAGRFQLTLTIEDDDNGEAIGASWSVASGDRGEQPHYQDIPV